MLFQIYDRDKDLMGTLQLSGVLPANPSTIENAVERAAKDAFENIDYDDGADDPGDQFWDTLTDTLEKLGWVAERVFMDEINL